jgi:hypothetical protein
MDRLKNKLEMKLSINKTIAVAVLTVLPFAHYAQSSEDQNLTKQTTKNQIEMNTTQTEGELKILIDRFSMPESAVTEFTQRMNYNRTLIKSLPGFIRDDVYEMKDENGNWSVITIATWQNQNYINEAKKAVQEDYKRTGFNMQQFIQQRNIVLLERGIYQKLVK